MTSTRTLLDDWDNALDALNAMGRDRLRELGITLPIEQRAGNLGVARITVAGEMWQPVPDGFNALLIGIWAPEPPSLLHATTYQFELLDIVATRTDRPDRWWLRLGTADPVLGEHNLHAAIDSGRAIQFHDTPMGWLTAGAEGVCFLDWSARFRQPLGYSLALEAA